MEVASSVQNQPEQTKLEIWQKHLKAWRASGLSQRKFCNQRQLNYPQFIYWRQQSEKQLKRKAKSAQGEKLVSVKVPNNTNSSSTHCIRLRLPNGVMAEVPIMLSADKLKHFLHCLGVTQ